MENKKIIESQMKIADEVLDALETFDPTCILAGGAPRDWFFERPASDLDFYVHFRVDLQNFYYLNILNRLGLGIFTLRGREDKDFPSNYKRNPDLMSVNETQYRGIKIQVMRMRRPTFRCVVDTFPLDICMAWYKMGKIHTHPEFNRCVVSRTISMRGNGYMNYDKYILKILRKFPNFSFRDASGNIV